MIRVALVCHASTAATRTSAFPADEPLDALGRRRAEAVAIRVYPHARCVTSPALRARETATVLGLVGHIEPALRECDYGLWTSRTFDDVQATDPAGLAQWRHDPDAAPHQGEALSALLARVAAWLDREASGSGTLVAVTHASIVKAAIVHALGAPAAAFWRVDIAPLSLTRLRHSHGTWTVAGTNAKLYGSCDADGDG